ncbi:hypothetical protein D3C73_791480 [compost metagenome]
MRGRQGLRRGRAGRGAAGRALCRRRARPRPSGRHRRALAPSGGAARPPERLEEAAGRHARLGAGLEPGVGHLDAGRPPGHVRRLDAAHEGGVDGAGLSGRRRAGQCGVSGHGRLGRCPGQLFRAGAGGWSVGRRGGGQPAAKRGAVGVFPAAARSHGAAGRAGPAGSRRRLLGWGVDAGADRRRAARLAQAQPSLALGRAAPGQGPARHAGTRTRVGRRHVCRAVPLRARHHRQPCPYGWRTRAAAIAADCRRYLDRLDAAAGRRHGGAAAGIAGRQSGPALGGGQSWWRRAGRAGHAGAQPALGLRAAPPGRARIGPLCR